MKKLQFVVSICVVGIFTQMIYGTPIETNVALNKPAWATAELYGQASAAVDGIPSAGGHCWNSGAHGTTTNPVVLFVDLENVYAVNQINLYADCSPISGHYESYALLSSTDNASWEIISSGDLGRTSTAWPKTLQFAPTAMRYLRFEETGGTTYAHLYEMEVFAIPEPATMLLFGLGRLIIRKRK